MSEDGRGVGRPRQDPEAFVSYREIIVVASPAILPCITGDLRALAGDTLPPTGPPHEHVDVPIRHFKSATLAGADEMPGKPDDGRVAVDLHREFVQGRRVDLLVEFSSQRQLLGLVASGAIAVRRDEFVRQDVLDETDVFAEERGVPILLELNQDLLFRSYGAILRSRGGNRTDRSKNAEKRFAPRHVCFAEFTSEMGHKYRINLCFCRD